MNYGWMVQTSYRLMSSLSIKVTNVFELNRESFAQSKVVVSLQLGTNHLNFGMNRLHPSKRCHSLKFQALIENA